MVESELLSKRVFDDSSVDLKKAKDWADRENPKVAVLFDVDGTLTPARKVRFFVSLDRYSGND